MAKTKVLIVDDSAFMRRIISDIISADADMIVETARNGQDALSKIERFQPDVVTLDVEMPVMDGLETLKIIKRNTKIPVLMLSSATKQGAEKTFQALYLGAVDFITKPEMSDGQKMMDKSQEILNKIKIAAGNKNKIPYSKTTPPPLMSASEISPLPYGGDPGALKKLIIIGVSTGGPKALYEILPEFPEKLGAGILIVQHMPAGFTKSLANNLNKFAAIEVKEAEDGEEIRNGCAYIAPGDFHMHVSYRQKGNERILCVKLNDGPRRDNLRPSVNEMFESVARQWKGKLVAVILTGMGNDGTESLPVLKAGGATIIAEDQSTCIIYGMPKAAVESGYVDAVAPLNKIVKEVLKNL
ncbi:MAG: chemotaxis response regulator protein-glutamate methylesterase [Syntrophomonadaceae bacterium]|nr:chemotaxis response regulator protein-glutamate methylesterase [Syntrophomonadaceae bacterium]